MQAQERLLWFRRLSLLGAILAGTVIVLGAWVRLTDAGLGCPDWPGCYGHVFPQGGESFAKALHEMIHRYFASSLGLVVCTLLAWALINRRDPGQPVAPVVGLFVLILAQGALGRLTVTMLLRPLIVTAHLLGGMTTFGILCWLSQAPRRRDMPEPERGLRLASLAALCVLALQIALGGWTSSNYAGIACPDFPTCRSDWWPRMDYRRAFLLNHALGVDDSGGPLQDPARVAIHVTHRLGALAVGFVLTGLSVATFLRARSRRLRFAGGLLFVAVITQICIGIAAVSGGLPLPLATLHNAGAALLVLATVTLLRALWPNPAVAMVPCADGHRSR
jgi:cytochrome c oxidase assembly protein subunit 15